jgi:hypothetical protein
MIFAEVKMPLFSNKIYNFYRNISPETVINNFWVVIPAWKYHIYISKRKDLDIFAETILRMLNAGEYDRGKIAEVLGLNVQLVKHIVNSVLTDEYFDGNRLTETGQKYLERGYGEAGEIFDGFIFQNVIDGKLWNYFCQQFDELSKRMDGSMLMINTASRDAPNWISAFPVLWNDSPFCNPATSDVVNILQNNEITMQTGVMINNAELINIAETPEAVYLLCKLNRSTMASEQNSWRAFHPFREEPDGETTALMRVFQERDSELNDKVNNFFFEKNQQLPVGERQRTALSNIASKCKYLSILPEFQKEYLIAFEERLIDARRAMTNNARLKHKVGMEDAVINLRRFVEQFLWDINKKYNASLSVIIPYILKNKGDDRLLKNYLSTALQRLNIDSSSLALFLNPYDLDRDNSYKPFKLLTALVLQVFAASVNEAHPLREVIKNNSKCLHDFVNWINKFMNKSAHPSEDFLKDMDELEKFIFSELEPMIKFTYNPEEMS